jgi:hypothetical protein
MGALGASAGGAAGFAFDVNGSYSVPILASVCDKHRCGGIITANARTIGNEQSDPRFPVNRCL